MLVHTISHDHPAIIGGVCVHACNFFNALEKLMPLVRTKFVPGMRFELTAQNADVHINLTLKDYWDLLNNPQFKGKKIAYPVFEWTNTENFPKLFEQHDQLWVPSQWQKDNIIKSGYDANKVKVIPEGVDPTVFNPQIKPNREVTKVNKFKFLCVARLDVRKSLDTLLEAFIEEFTYQPNVMLMLAPITPNTKIISHPQIAHINTVVHHEQLNSLYTACDAFVLPSKAEGWGLPICEAMACGLPTITTNYSAMTEFCNEDTTYFVNHELKEMPDDWNGLKNPGMWAIADKAHLKHLMRHIYENREEAKEKGLKASKHILENFTWGMAAQKAKQALDAI